MLHFGKWKVISVLLLCLISAAFAAPNLLTREQADALPSWLPHRQISLGLDLQGGSHLLLQVDTAAVVREHLEGLVDSIREELRKARIRYQDLRTRRQRRGGHHRRSGAGGRGDQAAARPRPRRDRRCRPGGRLRLVLSERQIQQRQSAAVEQSLEIVRRRIDETGVREPSIQRQGSDRILVQLPGLDDPQRIKALIGKTAKMTFHLLDDAADLGEALAGRAAAGHDAFCRCSTGAPRKGSSSGSW